MPKIDIIIPTKGPQSKGMTITAIKSFLRFSDGFDFKIHVVENFNDASYVDDDILSLSDNINWIQNPLDVGNGSIENGLGIKRGLEEVESDFVFFCHNDVAACHPKWMHHLYDKIVNFDHHLCGFLVDPHPERIKAIHISGMLLTVELANSVDIMDFRPPLPTDVGDNSTQYCRDNNLKYYCTPNTRGNSEEWALERCKEPFRSYPYAGRALDDNNDVLYMHLHRGTYRAHGWRNDYDVNDWISFVEDNVL